jgi:hypothetical protein
MRPKVLVTDARSKQAAQRRGLVIFEIRLTYSFQRD